MVGRRLSVARAVAYLWALPISAIGLLWAVLAVLTGGRARWHSGVLETQGGFARLLLTRLLLGGGADALTLGHVVLAVDGAAHDRWRSHERVHVAQAERWGLLFPLAYLLAGAAARIRGGDGYRDNPFERAAIAAEEPPLA